MKTSATGQTVGMRLVSAKLPRQIGPLARYLAHKRTPGPDWLSYEKIAAELATLTHETVTRAGVEKWAKTLGIPKTEADASDAERAAYLAAVERYLKR